MRGSPGNAGTDGTPGLPGIDGEMGREGLGIKGYMGEPGPRVCFYSILLMFTLNTTFLLTLERFHFIEYYISVNSRTISLYRVLCFC